MKSSPVQIPGTTWGNVENYRVLALASKTDGTLWTWGLNEFGGLGQNDRTSRSSPVQIPGTTWTNTISAGYNGGAAIKTDGTLWSWGYNGDGQLGINEQGSGNRRSSPVQIPGTTWSKIYMGMSRGAAIKTDGTLWVWGNNYKGQLGVNTQGTKYSSPTQIPGTNWNSFSLTYNASIALKSS